MKKRKMTKKWIKMTESILCTTAVLTCCATVLAAETDSSVDYATMPEYSSYEEIIGDTAAAHDGNGNYALYDIDQDGTKELIISFGESNADWMNYVYTLENGTPVFIGNFSSPVMLYVADDNNGIYSVYGHMGYQKVDRITKQDKQILTETVMEGDVGDGEYYSNASPILQASFTGYDTTQNNTASEVSEENRLSGMPNYIVDFSGTGKADGYLFPDSSNYMFQGYSEQYQAWIYQYGINEIYARHGYVFQTPEVAALFSEKTWYSPDESFDESCLSDVERYNIDFFGECLSTNGGDADYGIPSNEQSEPADSYESTGNMFDQYGGYYTNPDTYRIMKIYATNSSYSPYEGTLEISKQERVSPDEGGVSTYGLEQTSEDTAKIILDKKNIVSECGTMTFYDGGVDIYWSDGINETYVTGTP